MAQFSDKFQEGIALLDITDIKDGNGSLIFVTELSQNSNLSPKELFSLEAAQVYDADAVYFRKFDDGRLPVPVIYFYDNTSGRYDSKKYAEIHRNLWSSCIIPLFIIVENTQVKIFDSRNKVKIQGDDIHTDPIETIQFSAAAFKFFSAKFLDNGTFWEQSQNQNKFLASTSAYNDLIEGLRNIRKKFLEVSRLPEITAHKLLVLSILIKYLEERGEEGGSIFSRNFFKQFGSDDFCGVLRKKGKIVSLFEKLSSHFNGRVFEWTDSKEISLLKSSDLSALADYLDGNVKNSQYVIWRLYSFNHLPVELISNVYEEFLGKGKKDIVYTPHFLVNLLVDECMPIEQPKDDFKIIDPSCGSGIFLVVAFKRLVQWNRYKHYQETGELKHPTVKQLLNILTKNIYGVDQEGDAVRLTIFSLALALCDMLSPKEIWTQLKFEDLSEKNIITDDFFSFFNTNTQKFQLVIGNPPFDEFTKTDFDKLIKKHRIEPGCKIPQNQIALLFLNQSIKLLETGGLQCLIMPSGPLLYNDTLEFRKSFFEKYNVLQILDLTNLRRFLFEKADVPTAIIFTEANKPDEKNISHIIVSKTKSAKEKIYFEIDHYDFNEVTRAEAISSDFIWKSNLLGGRRLFSIVQRLSQLRTVGEFIVSKRDVGWKVGEGFIVGVKDRKFKAPHITGKPSLPTEAFTEDGVDESLIYKETELNFKYPAYEELFTPPLVLIKENIGEKKIPVYFSKKYLTFKDKIVGIKAPKKDTTELENLYDYLQKRNDLFRLYIAATSNQIFINKNTAILKQDLMAIPYPEHLADLKLSFAEKIIKDDVLKYGFEYLRRNDNKITKEEANKDFLVSFAEVFCKALNSVYGEENSKSFKLNRIIESNSWFACDFSFTGRDLTYKYLNSAKAEDDLTHLIENNLKKNLRINRIVRYYSKNTIILVKPKQLRYWLKSSALRDADDSLQDLIKAGY